MKRQLPNTIIFSTMRSGKTRGEPGIVDPHLHSMGLSLSTEYNEKSMLQRLCQSH